jgi:hypothetical protein
MADDELTPWIKLAPEDDAVIAEIENERDRGAALIASAFVEERLEETIKIRLREDTAVAKRLFRGVGPLGGFSAKIHLGYMLQLYSIESHNLLDQIRDVRNDFAHQTQPIDFNNEGVMRKCAALSRWIVPSFLESHAFAYQIARHARGVGTKFIVPTPSGRFGVTFSIDPKRNYITAVKLALFVLALAKQVYQDDLIPTPKPGALPQKSAQPPAREARAPNPHRRKRKLRQQSSPA